MMRMIHMQRSNTGTSMLQSGKIISTVWVSVFLDDRTDGILNIG
jgi:hypothetical protein